MKFVTPAGLKDYGIELGRVALWRMEREGKFPKRVNISANRIGWVQSEIEAWIKAKADAREADAKAA